MKIFLKFIWIDNCVEAIPVNGNDIALFIDFVKYIAVLKFYRCFKSQRCVAGECYFVQPCSIHVLKEKILFTRFKKIIFGTLKPFHSKARKTMYGIICRDLYDVQSNLN
ncbi:hypothetical protein ACKWTF_007474 [Chironomus riparius]